MAEGVHPRGTCASRTVQLKKNITAQPVNKWRIFAALLKDVIMQPPGSKYTHLVCLINTLRSLDEQ
jgi:hypothetical protein